MLRKSNEIKDLSPDERLELAKQLNQQAIDPQTEEEDKKTLLLKGIHLIESIKEQDRTPTAWRYLIALKYNMGIRFLGIDDISAIEWYKKSIQCFSQIEKPTSEHWFALADVQDSLGSLYESMLKWPEASAYLLDALRSFYKSATENKEAFTRIIKIYAQLESLSMHHPLEKILYSFAQKVFFEPEFPTFKNELLALHLAILKSNEPLLLTQLALLMRFLVLGFEKSFLPNNNVKQLLSDDENRQRFMEILSEIEKPKALIDTVQLSSPSFTLAVAVKLAELEDSIKVLAADNREKEEIIKTMKERIRYLEEKNSVYSSPITVFRCQTPSPPTDTQFVERPPTP